MYSSHLTFDAFVRFVTFREINRKHMAAPESYVNLYCKPKVLKTIACVRVFLRAAVKRPVEKDSGKIGFCFC